MPYETLWIHACEAWSTDPREAARRIALHGRMVLSRFGTGAHIAEPVTERAWSTLLADRFDLPLDSNTAAERDRLWTSVITAHRRWAATQR